MYNNSLGKVKPEQIKQRMYLACLYLQNWVKGGLLKWSAYKGTNHQVWWPEFDFQGTQNKSKKSTSTTYLMTSPCTFLTHKYLPKLIQMQHSKEINKQLDVLKTFCGFLSHSFLFFYPLDRSYFYFKVKEKKTPTIWESDRKWFRVEMITRISCFHCQCAVFSIKVQWCLAHTLNIMKPTELCVSSTSDTKLRKLITLIFSAIYPSLLHQRTRTQRVC